MLAFYFIKSLSRRGIAFFDHLVHSFIVEIVDRLFDVNVLLRAAACCRADIKAAAPSHRRMDEALIVGPDEEVGYRLYHESRAE